MHLPFSDGPEGRILERGSADEARPSGPLLKETLGYAPPLPVSRRRAAWVVAAVVGAVGSAWIANWYGPAVWQRGAMLYWQHRCMTATAPDDIVVDANDGGESSVLAGDEAFRRFCAARSAPVGSGLITAFVHERFTPDGRPLLVVVQGLDQQDKAGSITSLFTRTFRPGSLSRPATEVLRAGPGVAWWAPQTHLCGGQPDGANPAHFTLRGSSKKGPFTVDGWVRDDETVVLEIRP